MTWRAVSAGPFEKVTAQIRFIAAVACAVRAGVETDLNGLGTPRSNKHLASRWGHIHRSHFIDKARDASACIRRHQAFCPSWPR